MTLGKHVVVIFGGISAEHEVSVQSARAVVRELRSLSHDVSLVGIDKQGNWYFVDSAAMESMIQVAYGVPGVHRSPTMPLTPDGSMTHPDGVRKIDVVFPVLHGPFGEDGSIQGLLRLSNVPFVGAGVLGSAVGMDKDVMKRLLRDAGLPVTKFRVVGPETTVSFDELQRDLGPKVFVKPANMGSSIGVSMVTEASSLVPALLRALAFDSKVIVEAAVSAREIECGVLGNNQAAASVCGEVIPSAEFYTYDAKYSSGGARLVVPADIPAGVSERIRELALLAFSSLYCSDMARIDFFYTTEGDILINEINTIPGFTPTSMYPLLWQVTGLSYASLISELLDLTIERFSREVARGALRSKNELRVTR